MTIDGLHPSVKRRILGKLNGRVLPKLVRLDEEQHELQKILENTIVDREGNSYILMGPRSSGKSTLVNICINKMEQQYPDQFLVIRLSGFALSDDKMALREICRQLDVELLERGEDDQFDENGELFEKKSMAETMSTLLTVFERGASESVAVIFFLEELDRFVYHSRQTLLYNLLEISQTSTVGIAVIGLTTQITTRELLEKRVRSRFSQRIRLINRPTSIESFWDVCRTNIFIDDPQDDLSKEWNQHLNVSTFFFSLCVAISSNVILVRPCFTISSLHCISWWNRYTIQLKTYDNLIIKLFLQRCMQTHF